MHYHVCTLRQNIRVNARPRQNSLVFHAFALSTLVSVQVLVRRDGLEELKICQRQIFSDLFGMK